jgi:hypothetical protein
MEKEKNILEHNAGGVVMHEKGGKKYDLERHHEGNSNNNKRITKLRKE